MTRRRFARLACIGLLAGLVAACNSHPAGVAPPNTREPGSHTNNQPELRSIHILGAPANVHIGASATARAVALYSDGGYVDVTDRAAWRSAAGACSVSAAGLITGMSAGFAEITADFGGVSSAPVRVACGFVITVTVHETFPTEHIAVPGTRGEVLDGPLAGHTFITDDNGRATLPPVAAAGLTLHLKKPGFENTVQRVVDLPREVSLRVPLTPEFGQRRELGGGCETAGSSTILTDGFTMPRAGKVRLFVEFTRNDTDIPNAEVRGTVQPVAAGSSMTTAAFELSPGPGGPRPGTAEMRTDAGPYTITFRAANCDALHRWRAVLEYSR